MKWNTQTANFKLPSLGQKKLIRFAELLTFPNVLQYPENMAGNWKKYFKNDNPITLELACGKGEYAVGLAQLYLEKNFIGVDQKEDVFWLTAPKRGFQIIEPVLYYWSFRTSY